MQNGLRNRCWRCKTNADYLELVDFTGRMIHPGKRGVIKGTEPKAVAKLGLDPKHWSDKVKGIGIGFARRLINAQTIQCRNPSAAFAAGGVGVCSG